MEITKESKTRKLFVLNLDNGARFAPTDEIFDANNSSFMARCSIDLSHFKRTTRMPSRNSNFDFCVFDEIDWRHVG